MITPQAAATGRTENGKGESNEGATALAGKPGLDTLHRFQVEAVLAERVDVGVQQLNVSFSAARTFCLEHGSGFNPTLAFAA